MRILTLLLIFTSLACRAQFSVSGTVREYENNTPLPFATITTDRGQTLATDIDGKFSTNATTYFTVSYTGYEAQRITVQPGKKSYHITLKPHSEQLKEVVLQSNNAANSLMRKVLYLKSNNDPAQRLDSYKYKTYNKLLVTANPDSISGKLDSIYVYEKLGRRFSKIDSSDFKFKKLIEKQHLYQTEKVSEYNYNKEQGLKENVLGTRMAGFKKPLYEIIGLTLQSHTVYQDKLELLETKYAGPLSDDALDDYRYKILDTLTIAGREAYMVYFTPHRTGKRKKLEGILYIDSQSYGVAKAVFRVKNVLDITSTHNFKYEPEMNLWFPDSKSLKIVKGNNKQDIKILGETIKFDADDKDRSKRESVKSDYVYLLSESYNFEKQFNIPVTIRHSAVAIEITEEATTRPETYWNRYRRDTLDTRSMKTYTALDSIVARDNWEYKIFLGKKIINGYVPVGFFDIDLRDIFKYNNYEGIRIGLGGITNDKFAETYRISGYGAYGTKDGQFKYQTGAALRLGRFTNSWIGFSYTDDVREIGSTSFATDKRVFKLYDPRPINISTFYNHQTWQAYLETRIIPKTETRWQAEISRIDPKFNYLYSPGGKDLPLFHLATATAAIQWNPFSDYMQTPTGRVEVDKRFPKFAFQYTQALNGLLGGDLTFGKFDFRMEVEKSYLNGQKTSGLLQTGLAIGDTPLTHLYSTSPNNLDRDGVLERVTLAGKNSFETMYFNEFFSSRYVILQLKHGMSRFNISNSIKLSPMLVTRFAYGKMEDRDEHTGITFNTLEKGYYESGIELNEIFKGLGLSAFYRYGPYHLPEFDRNISMKISFVLNIL